MRYTIFDIPILRNLLQGLSLVGLKIFGWRRFGPFMILFQVSLQTSQLRQ
jgi:hypothetical protein